MGSLISWKRQSNQRQTWQRYGISPGLWLSLMCSSRTCSDSNANSQILQLAVGGDQRRSYTSPFGLTVTRAAGTRRRTRGLDEAVSALDVALQLERGHVLPVAVLAGGVAVPALAVLLLQLQVVLHVVHEPAGRSQKEKQCFTHGHQTKALKTKPACITAAFTVPRGVSQINETLGVSLTV